MTPAADDGFSLLPPNTRLRMLLAVHGPVWLELARAITRDLQYAEDAVSEALAALAVEWSNGPGPDDPVTWTAAVVRNLALKRCAREDAQRRLAVRLHTERAGGGESAGDAVPARDGPERGGLAERRELLSKALPSIPERQREVLRMRVIEERSPAEIARCLECSEGAVRAAQHKAVKSVRKWLEHQQQAGDE